MTGTIVNAAAIVAGGGIGLLFRKGLPERFAKAVMTGVALCVLYIGLSGALAGNNTMVMTLSVVAGALIGEWLDLDGRLNKLGTMIEGKFQKEGGRTSIAEGFVTASLLFCVGAMAIVGSLQSGMTGNHETLFTKSMLDFVAAVIFASSLGAGVLCSSVCVLLYQGMITLLAQFIAPFLKEAVVAEMTCVGSLLIIALALNMLNITKIKVMNYLPAVFLPVAVMMFLK